MSSPDCRFIVETEIETGRAKQTPHACPSSREEPCESKAFKVINEDRMHTDYQVGLVLRL